MGIVALLYGAICYFIFFAVFLYMIVFVGGDALSFLPFEKTVDAGASAFSAWPAALVNLGLVLLFGLQHTVMARPGFKKGFTKIVPEPMERSTYVLVTSLILAAIYHLWIPMPAVVWTMGGVWQPIMLALFFLGAGIILLSTFLINHFELFGLHQVWSRFKSQPMPDGKFYTPFLYKIVRHPLYLGFLIFFWATPHMTVGHLLFSAGMTVYMLIAISYEERDLTTAFGDQYRDYMARVPMIIPFGKRK